MYVSPIANDILAGHLINYGAVSFMTDAPMRLKSGLVTPIYVDNRSLTGHPDAWRDIIETTCSRIAQLGLKFDIIAGVEGAGVSHAAALAYRLGKPSIFVRQRAKIQQYFFFRPVEHVRAHRLDFMPQLRMADDVIDRRIEIIRYSLQNFDFRLDIMVFIFIDRRLADADGICQPLLTDSLFLPERFQVRQHAVHLLHALYCNNQIE